MSGGQVRIAVVGAGLVGRQHVRAIGACDGAVLAGIVDPAEWAEDLAGAFGAPHHADLAAMLATDRPDGVIVATPNRLHEAQGLACVEAGVPVLVEKPISSDVASAGRLVRAAEAAAVPLLVGHHRRHSPIVAAARARIAGGAIGAVVAVQATCWLCKPDDYFEAAWRKEPGAGPVLINLIHDIDLLRYLCGEVRTVRAFASNRRRGHGVEDTAAAVMELDGGALATVTVSDTVVAPWSWELTAGENPAYPDTGQSCYLIGGTHGSLEVPSCRLWSNPGPRSWWEPIHGEAPEIGRGDPLALQIAQFRRVIAEGEAPLVPGREGLRTLQVIEAIRRAAATGATVEPFG